MSTQSILLVEYEHDIKEIIKMQLESKGFHVEALTHGGEAISLIQKKDFDLYILDRMLPGNSGIEVCRFIRAYEPSKTKPILFVTALGQSSDIVEGLEAGADDYVTKPFDLTILTARVSALLRRSKGIKVEADKKNLFMFGPIKIDRDRHKVSVSNETISLTISEYKLLCTLIDYQGKVLSRQKLVEQLVGTDVSVTERTIDTHVFGLRKKLKSAANFIETIRGIGYRMAMDSE